MKNRLITTVFLVFVLCAFVAHPVHSLDLDDVKHALVGARDLIPDIRISYTRLRRIGPNPSYAEFQKNAALTSLNRKHLSMPLDRFDALIQDILDKEVNPDGTTQQEYSISSYLSGNKLKTISETDIGPIIMFGQYRIAITDGQNVTEGLWLGSDEIGDNRMSWYFTDHDRRPYSKSGLSMFDGAMYSPSFFGYTPGETFQGGYTVRSAAFYEDRPEIAFVELNDPEGELMGYFEVDTSKGLIATRGLFYLTPHYVNTYSFIQYELHDVREIHDGFYFPQSATILRRHRNSDRALPEFFIENPQPSVSDNIEEITFNLIEIPENGVPGEEFIAPVKAGDQVDDHRAAIVKRVNEGVFPHDLFFEDLILNAMQIELETHGSIPGLSGGIAGPEYDYLKIP